MKSATITLRAPLELIHQLDRLAATTQRTRSTLGCEAIRRFLDLESEQTANIHCPVCEGAGAGLLPQPSKG